MTDSRYSTFGDGPNTVTVTFDDDGSLVFNWYHFGDHLLYEWANILSFAADTHARFFMLAEAGAVGDGQEKLLGLIAQRFSSLAEVKAFAQHHGIAFTESTDMWP